MLPKHAQWLLETPIAHRGLHDDNREVPENSLAACSLAMEKGYPIELDVHLAKDGSVLVFHDERLKRMCGSNARITDLRKTDLADFRLAHTSERIPRIEEVLALVAGRVPLLIETKTTRKPGLLEAKLYGALQHYGGAFAVQSFNPFHMAWFAQNAPDIIRIQLASNFRTAKMPWPVRQSLKCFLYNRISKPLLIGYYCGGLPNRSVAHQREQGRPVLTWTVRSQEEYERLQGLCDNIIFEGFIPQPPAGGKRLQSGLLPA